jgi:hypothetical protein
LKAGNLPCDLSPVSHHGPTLLAFAKGQPGGGDSTSASAAPGTTAAAAQSLPAAQVDQAIIRPYMQSVPIEAAKPAAFGRATGSPREAWLPGPGQKAGLDLRVPTSASAAPGTTAAAAQSLPAAQVDQAIIRPYMQLPLSVGRLARRARLGCRARARRLGSISGLGCCCLHSPKRTRANLPTSASAAPGTTAAAAQSLPAAQVDQAMCHIMDQRY